MLKFVVWTLFSGIAKLSQPIDITTTVCLLCLPTEEKDYASKYCTVTGYGKAIHDDSSIRRKWETLTLQTCSILTSDA